jgi:predicted transposase YbfD/YdcC
MSKQSVLTVGKSLAGHLEKITDPRVNRTKDHKLINILVISVMAALCGADNWVEIADWGMENQDWLDELLGLDNGIPSHDTFGRVFAVINPEEFQNAFREWAQIISSKFKGRKIIAIDGKFLRGALKEAGNSRSAIIMVNAWASDSGLSMAQLTCKLKKGEGEKIVMEKMIDCLDVRGDIVTLDAGGATTTIFDKIVSKGGDVIIGLKDNQKSLHRLAKDLFDCEKNKLLIEQYVTEEKGHGRIEKRTVELLSIDQCETSGMDQVLQKQKEKWKNLKGIGRVTCEKLNISTNKESVETRYFICSFGTDAKEFGNAVRTHWGIENNLHWQLDVSFREDHVQARVGHAAENFAVVRQMCLNMLKNNKTENRSIRRKRLLCGWRKEYLLEIIFGQE